MIQVDHLIKEYGDFRAVDDLSFEVFEGEILGFLGPNGAGKTTTMRILTCYFPPTSGTARVAGYDVVEDPYNVRRAVGYMPEGVPLYREMTVWSALDFVAHAKGYKSTQRKKYVADAIEETGLGEVRYKLIGQLSKGYRQRVGLAQAVIGEPKVLILDEPTASLDPKQIADVRTLIKSMAGRRTVILSTHILPEVQMTCSRVLIINRGRIAASGTPEKLTSQMQTRYEVVAKVMGPLERVSDALREIEGVDRVETRAAAGEGGAVDYHITTVTGVEDIHPQVASVIVGKGWQLLELRTVGLTLEDIFLKVVAGETAAAIEARGAASA